MAPLPSLPLGKAPQDRQACYKAGPPGSLGLKAQCGVPAFLLLCPAPAKLALRVSYVHTWWATLSVHKTVRAGTSL
jgi:hypothetical protein